MPVQVGILPLAPQPRQALQVLSGHIFTGDQTPGGRGDARIPVQAGWITGGKTSQKAGPQLSFSAGPCLVIVWAQPPFPGLQRGGD